MVRNVDASKWSGGKAYLTIEAHQVGDFGAYAYRTEDYGASWTRIVDGVSDSPLSYTRNIREDPVRPGLLYLGTENFLYVSFDDGDNWQRLANGLPPSPMYWITVQERFSDLVVGTYGRGFWIMDDITPLQQWDDAVEAAEVHLFDRARCTASIRSPRRSRSSTTGPPGRTRPYGAPISYWLDEEAEEVELLVQKRRRRDDPHARGQRRCRVEPRLVEPARGAVHRDASPHAAERRRLGGVRRGSLPRRPRRRTDRDPAPPGNYRIVLEARGERREADLEVLKDPHSEGSLADIAAQTELLRELRKDMESVAGMVNEIEWVRRQLLDVQAVAEETGRVEAIASAVDGFEGALIAVEERLIPAAAHRNRPGLGALAEHARRTDRLSRRRPSPPPTSPPTDQMREVHGRLRERLRTAEAEYRRILESELPEVKRRPRRRRGSRGDPGPRRRTTNEQPTRSPPAPG